MSEAQQPLTLAMEKSQLQRAYDKLNAVWERAEEKVRSLMVPLECWVTIRPHGDQSGIHFGWIKFGGKFRLCWGYESSAGIDFRPVLDRTIDVKVGAVEHIERLFNLVRSKMGTTYCLVENARSALSATLERLHDESPADVPEPTKEHEREPPLARLIPRL